MLKSRITPAEDNVCLRYLSTRKTVENITQIMELIHRNRHLTIHELVNEIGI
jgi:hypothetical protein